MPPAGMPPMGNASGMPPMGNASGLPPMGNASGMPPMGDHTGMPAVTGKRSGGKMGNYGCGQKNRRKHVNCLRRLLDTTPHGLTVAKGKRGLGKYGCGQKNRRKHVNCLRRLLDQHGPQLAKGSGGKRGMAPGTSGMSPMGDHSGMPAVTGKRPGGKMGNYGCGTKNRKKHVNCLRDLLDTTPLSAKVKHAKKGKKRGFYKCGNKNKKKHTNCLRRLLDEHGPELAVKRGMAPGTR
jgi:hypothetical protein